MLDSDLGAKDSGLLVLSVQARRLRESPEIRAVPARIFTFGGVPAADVRRHAAGPVGGMEPMRPEAREALLGMTVRDPDTEEVRAVKLATGTSSESRCRCEGSH